MRSDPFAERFIELLEAHGISDYSFGRGAKRPYLVVNHGGVTYTHAYPGTSGDRRATRNAVSALKHQLGLVTTSRKPDGASDHARARRKPRRKSSIVHMTVSSTDRCSVEDHYYSRLEEIRLQLLASEAPVEACSCSPEAPGGSTQRARHRLRCPFLGQRVRYQEEMQ